MKSYLIHRHSIKKVLYIIFSWLANLSYLFGAKFTSQNATCDITACKESGVR